jgi:hypothetical protein
MNKTTGLNNGRARGSQLEQAGGAGRVFVGLLFLPKTRNALSDPVETRRRKVGDFLSQVFSYA